MTRLVSSTALSIIALAVLGSASGVSAQSPEVRTAGDAVTLVACVVREADYARVLPSPAGEGVQLLLADVKTGLPSHSVTGLREADLAAQVGKRIEVSGTVERARTTPVLTTADGTRTGVGTAGAAGASGVTHEGAAAHEPADAVASAVRAGAATAPAPKVEDPAYRAATLPRLNAASFKPVSGACVMPANVNTASAAPAAIPAAPRSALAAQATAPGPESIVARGCLVRQTAGGTALTASKDQRDPLVLTNAVLVNAVDQVAGGGSVTGAPSAATGSGTIPESVGTSGRAAVDATTMAFALETGETERATLGEHVGERVEITGTTPATGSAAGGATVSAPAGASGAGRDQPAADVAHPSAPTRTIAVTAFRALGGTCN